MNSKKNLFNLSKEEIIKAGLIGLCYECDEIFAFTDAEHIKLNDTFTHWYTGEEFEGDWNNIWLVQYIPEGITSYNLINY